MIPALECIKLLTGIDAGEILLSKISVIMKIVTRDTNNEIL
jgi:hypothetical protein